MGGFHLPSHYSSICPRRQVLYELETNDFHHKAQPEEIEQKLDNPDFWGNKAFPLPDKKNAPLITLPAQRFEVERFQAGGMTFSKGSLVKLELGRGVKGDTRSIFYAHIKRIYRRVHDEDHDATNILVQRFTWRPERYEIHILHNLAALPVRVDESMATGGTSSGGKKAAKGQEHDRTAAKAFITRRDLDAEKGKPHCLSFLPLGHAKVGDSGEISATWQPSGNDMRITERISYIAVVAKNVAQVEIADNFLGVHLRFKIKRPGESKYSVVDEQLTLFSYPTKYRDNQVPYYSFKIPQAQRDYPFRELGEYQIQAIGKDHAGNHVTSARSATLNSGHGLCPGCAHADERGPFR